MQIPDIEEQLRKKKVF